MNISIVLPVYNQADHLEKIIIEYVAALDEWSSEWEIILVPNGCRDNSEEICACLSQKDERIRSESSTVAGWGNAVRHGISCARGENICFTNSARTDSRDLLSCVKTISTLEEPVIIKANRVEREGFIRRVGSMLYNFENRVLFGIRTKDINGTPKIFPASCKPLLCLRETGDLLDLEFIVTCMKYGVLIFETPVYRSKRHGGKSTTKWKSAVGMYIGSLKYWWEQREK